MMKQAINFTYDGIKSEDMGVYIGWEGGGLFEESFIPSRSIRETKVKNNVKPYFQGVDIEPLSFNLTLVIEDWEDKANLRRIAKWLFQDYYKPMIFETNIKRVFYVMPIGESSFFHNGIRSGYINLEFRGNSPYSYSQTINELNIQLTNEQKYTNIIDNNNFNEGQMYNVTQKEEGLTIDKDISTWGALIIKYGTWDYLIQ